MFDMRHGKKMRNCKSLTLGQRTIDTILNMANKNYKNLHIHLTMKVVGTIEVEPKLMMIFG